MKSNMRYANTVSSQFLNHGISTCGVDAQLSNQLGTAQLHERWRSVNHIATQIPSEQIYMGKVE